MVHRLVRWNSVARFRLPLQRSLSVTAMEHRGVRASPPADCLPLLRPFPHASPHLFEPVHIGLTVGGAVEAEGNAPRFEAGEGLVGIVFREVAHRRDLALEQVNQSGMLGQQPLQDVDAEGDVSRLVALNQPDAALEAGNRPLLSKIK